MAANEVPGWYGKLPAAGDFLRHRLDEKHLATWTHWFQQGLMQWHSQPDATLHHFLQSPVWNFILPVTPGIQQIQMGCLLPSCDRVGRAWPLLALRTFSPAEWHPSQLTLAGDWFQDLGKTLCQAVHEHFSAGQLEQQMQSLPALLVPGSKHSDIMDIIGFTELPCSLSWQEVAERFVPQQHISYWWTNRSDGFAHATHKHSGNLTSDLFTLLFNPATGAQPRRNGLYPPMFD